MQRFVAEKNSGLINYYRIKEKALSGALEALKNSYEKKDAEKAKLRKEIEKLKNIILSLAEEINLLKKDQLELLGPISGYKLNTFLKKELINIIENFSPRVRKPASKLYPLALPHGLVSLRYFILTPQEINVFLEVISLS